jgi:hypothetical protein
MRYGGVKFDWKRFQTIYNLTGPIRRRRSVYKELSISYTFSVEQTRHARTFSTYGLEKIWWLRPLPLAISAAWYRRHVLLPVLARVCDLDVCGRLRPTLVGDRIFVASKKCNISAVPWLGFKAVFNISSPPTSYTIHAQDVWQRKILSQSPSQNVEISNFTPPKKIGATLKILQRRRDAGRLPNLNATNHATIGRRTAQISSCKVCWSALPRPLGLYITSSTW